MWMCPWFLYSVGLCTGCCSDQSVCTLPADSGPCNVQYSLRWYFDPLSGQCRQFMHGGCGGNGNNFLTKSRCGEACNALPTDADFCKMPMDRGPCTAHYEKWYYEPSDGKCHLFIYGGCDGNDNRFDAEDECLAVCNHGNTAAQVEVAVPKSASGCILLVEPQTSLCTNIVRESPERSPQPLHPGPCQGSLPRWHFDSVTKSCLPFPYGGCHGNRNRFLTKEICLTECRSKLASVVASSSPGGARGSLGNTVAVETKKPSPSYGMTPRRLPVLDVHWSKTEDEQHKSNDGSSGPSKTRFEGQGKDQISGEDDIERAGVCHMTKDPGPCKEYAPVWYFESLSSTCRRFMYGGCQGNENRFASLKECQKTCLGGREELQQKIAWKKGTFFHAGMLPMNVTRSHNRLPPQMITSTGESNVRTAPLKRKETKDQKYGHAGLKKKTVESLESQSPVEHGVDKDRWQHDESAVESSQKHQQTAEESGHPISKSNVVRDRCRQPEDRGRLCAKWRIYWFHDDHVLRCRRFYFGGCDGNENRFKTLEDCVRACPMPKEAQS